MSVRVEVARRTTRRQYHCACCGYGISVIGKPKRCPMCGAGSSWQSAGGRSSRTIGIGRL